MTKFPTFIDFSLRRLSHESLHANYSARPINKNFIHHTEKLPPCTDTLDMRSITRCFCSCAEASGHKDQRALGTRIKESKLFENDHSEIYDRNLKRGVRLKDEKIRPNPQKRWINKSSMQSRNVHDFLTETVLFKQKQLDDISLRRIKMLFSG